jgi:hypothetical protein
MNNQKINSTFINFRQSILGNKGKNINEIENKNNKKDCDLFCFR